MLWNVELLEVTALLEALLKDGTPQLIGVLVLRLFPARRDDCVWSFSCVKLLSPPTS